MICLPEWQFILAIVLVAVGFYCIGALHWCKA